MAEPDLLGQVGVASICICVLLVCAIAIFLLGGADAFCEGFSDKADGLGDAVYFEDGHAGLDQVIQPPLKPTERGIILAYLPLRVPGNPTVYLDRSGDAKGCEVECQNRARGGDVLVCGEVDDFVGCGHAD